MAAVLREIMEGARRRPRRRASWSRCARRARRSTSSPGSRGRCARWRRPSTWTAPDLVDTCGTGGGAPTLQRLDDRGAPGGRRGRHGREARQPLGHGALRLGGRARGARRAHRPGAGRGRARASRTSASASCSRRGTTRRRATSCPCAASWRPHDLQPARPADQPGGRDHQVIGVYDPALLETMARRAGPARQRTALVVYGEEGSTRSRFGADPRGRAEGREIEQLHAHARGRRARRAPGRRRRAGDADGERGDHARGAGRAGRRRRARAALAERRRRARRGAARPMAIARGRDGAREAIDRGAARRSSTATSSRTAGAGAGMSVRSTAILQAKREEVGGASRAAAGRARARGRARAARAARSRRRSPGPGRR